MLFKAATSSGKLSADLGQTELHLSPFDVIKV